MKTKRFASIAILALLFFSSIGLVLAHAGEDEYGHHGMMMGGFGIGFFGAICMILVIVVLILLIIWLWKKIQEPSRKK